MVAVGIAGSRSCSVAGVELGLNEEGNKFPAAQQRCPVVELCLCLTGSSSRHLSSL